MKSEFLNYKIFECFRVPSCNGGSYSSRLYRKMVIFFEVVLHFFFLVQKLKRDGLICPTLTTALGNAPSFIILSTAIRILTAHGAVFLLLLHFSSFIPRTSIAVSIYAV